jgi:hypothetical protein
MLEGNGGNFFKLPRYYFFKKSHAKLAESSKVIFLRGHSNF